MIDRPHRPRLLLSGLFLLSTATLPAWSVGTDMTVTVSSGRTSKALSTPKLQNSESTYLVELDEPSALSFTHESQLGMRAKSLGLRPTAPAVTGERKFNAKSAAALAYRRFLADRHEQVRQLASSSFGREIKMTHRWDLVGNGFAVRLRASEAAQLRALPGIKSVRIEPTFEPATDVSTRFIGADAIWTGSVPGVPTSTRGQGVVVGILDSGINTAHPAFADVSSDGFDHSNPRGARLGLCAGGDPRCNDKLIGIYDYINEDGAVGASAGADVTGHGTHVAATAAGNPVSGTVSSFTVNYTAATTGVAPRANLVVYKVCGEEVQCPGGAIFSGINQAVADGVDVMNLSLGGATDESPWVDGSELLLSARNAGIVVAVAAGNAGPLPGSATRFPAQAPWVIAVGNSLSNKSFTTTLANINGTGVAAPFALSGQGISAGVGESEVVYAGDFGDATCSGSFVGGTFTGRIVVCDQGGLHPVLKGQRVSSAGAAGLVIANRPQDGNGNAADGHLLPAVHLGYAAGVQIKNAIATARQGSGQIRARIDGTTISSSGRGSVLNESSGKGPMRTYSGVLKPNISAPGTNIAAAYVPNANSFDALTGTSMASPHIAGAAALLIAANPTWSPSQVESALLTTADNNMLLEDALSPAKYVDAGAGMVNLRNALKAGLFFPVSGAEFTAANPAQDGDPSNLNLPAIHTDDCRLACAFVRTVTANVGGTWTIAAAANGASVQVVPSTITLAQGQSATLAINITASGGQPFGTWSEGQLVLTNTSSPASIANTVVPISVQFNAGPLPSLITINNAPASGSASFDLTGLVGIDEVTVRDAQLQRVEATRPSIGEDPTEDPFDNVSHVFTRFVAAPTVPAGASRDSGIFVEINSPNVGQDLDLYVGHDLNGDSIPEEHETLCVSASGNSEESCFVEARFLSATDQFWVVVQNFNNGQTLDAPNVYVYTGLLDGAADPKFSARSRLGKSSTGQAIPIELSWHLPNVPANERAVSVISVGGSRNDPHNVGLIPVLLRRDPSADLPPIVMNARNDSEVLVLQPGQAHERIVVDVPPNATALVFRSSGTGGNVDLYASKHTGALTPPTFAAAPPRLQQPFTSIHTGNNELIALEGTQLTPGRYYITPVNSGTTAATITLSTVGEFSANIVQPRANGYFNPGRDGHGVFLATTPQVWALAWYTFETDGKPIWYTASGAAAAAGDGLWTAPIYRSTWNGVRDNPQQVGEVILTFDGTGGFTYSWFLDGQYGSEPFQIIGNPVCANGNFSVGGGWLRPDQTGWGSYFLNFAGNAEAEALYVYDSNGLPRWVIGSGVYATTASKELLQISGFCPSCAFAPTTRQTIGTTSRTFTGTGQGTFSSNFSFTNGVSGSWVQNNVPWAKLTPDLSCP